MQGEFTVKPGFAGEPGAQAEVDNTAQAKHTSTDRPILGLRLEISPKQPDQDSALS